MAASEPPCARLVYAPDLLADLPPVPCGGPRWSPVHFPEHPLFHAYAPRAAEVMPA